MKQKSDKEAKQNENIQMPEQTKRLELLIIKVIGTRNELQFVNVLNSYLPEDMKPIKQQSINRLFKINKTNGKYPKISEDIRNAISYLPNVSMEWFLNGKENSKADTGETDEISRLKNKIEKLEKQIADYIDLSSRQREDLRRLEKELSQYKANEIKPASL